MGSLTSESWWTGSSAEVPEGTPGDMPGSGFEPRLPAHSPTTGRRPNAHKQAEQAVRDSRIDGEMPADGGCGGLTITRGITEPLVPDALLDEWRALGEPSQLFLVR